jgi:chromosome segregation ATPase
MIRSLEARIKRLKDANALLRTQNKQLTTETARLEEHRAYVRNAYDGLKHKHDHLLTGHPKTMARALAAENKAKESAANAAMWQARAEQAKQQIVDVQTKHDALRTTIRGHIREVSNELLDLSDRV